MCKHSGRWSSNPDETGGVVCHADCQTAAEHVAAAAVLCGFATTELIVISLQMRHIKKQAL